MAPDICEHLERELVAAQGEIVRLKGEAESWEQVFDRTCEHLAEEKSERAEAQAKISAMRRWVNNNMTFYDVEPSEPHGPNTPTLAGVSKRIWYHTTDNQTVSLFSEVIDLRQWEGK